MTQVYTAVKENKYLALPLALLVLYLFFKMFSTASELLTQLVVWGVCVETTEVVTTPVKTQVGSIVVGTPVRLLECAASIPRSVPYSKHTVHCNAHRFACLNIPTRMLMGWY